MLLLLLEVSAAGAANESDAGGGGGCTSKPHFSPALGELGRVSELRLVYELLCCMSCMARERARLGAAARIQTPSEKKLAIFFWGENAVSRRQAGKIHIHFFLSWVDHSALEKRHFECWCCCLATSLAVAPAPAALDVLARGDAKREWLARRCGGGWQAGSPKFPSLAYLLCGAWASQAFSTAPRRLLRDTLACPPAAHQGERRRVQKQDGKLAGTQIGRALENWRSNFSTTTVLLCFRRASRALANCLHCLHLPAFAYSYMPTFLRRAQNSNQLERAAPGSAQRLAPSYLAECILLCTPCITLRKMVDAFGASH